MARYRTNADDSIVCPHRDLSCCPACLAADERLVDVYGAVWLIADAEERDAFRSEIAALQAADAANPPRFDAEALALINAEDAR